MSELFSFGESGARQRLNNSPSSGVQTTRLISSSNVPEYWMAVVRTCRWTSGFFAEPVAELKALKIGTGSQLLGDAGAAQ